MRRFRVGFATVIVAFLATTAAAKRTPSPTAPTVTRQVIAVYFGTVGTDARSGMVEAVRGMRTALQRQTASSGRIFISHGVSLEGSIQEGLRHLALLGDFDEVSVGGNWTNSVVVKYLGGDMSDHQRAAIPQVVLLEREVRQDGPEKLVVGPEREIGRYTGAGEIALWVRNGAPLPQ